MFKFRNFVANPHEKGVMTMRQRYFFVAFIIVIILALFLGSGTASAQNDELRAEITYYKVTNLDDGTDVTDDNLMAGDSYEVRFEIDIGVTLGNNTLILATPLEKIGANYWELENDYAGVNTDTWQPGMSKIEFDMIKGNATFVLTGQVPSNYTSVKLPNDRYLHFPKDISLVQLSLGPENIPLKDQEREAEVIDQAISTYLRTLSDKEKILQDADADPKYEELATDLITLAEDLTGEGYVEEATGLLNTLPQDSSDFPIPVEEGSYTIYIIIIVIVAILLILILALFLRARSNSAFIRQQVDEEAGKLDVLSVRTSKIDRQLARDIEQIKEQLERICGR